MKQVVRFLLTALVASVQIQVCRGAGSSMLQLSASNLQQVVESNELVFIMFYADWCYYSNLLDPIFAEASADIASLYPTAGVAVLGRVDCEANAAICNDLKVTKYPSLKLFLYGQLVWREYRGQRSPEAMVEFIRVQLTDPVIEKSTLAEVDSVMGDVRLMAVYVGSADSESYRAIRQVAAHFRGDCFWWAVFGEASEPLRLGQDVLVFRHEMAFHPDERFSRFDHKADLMDFALTRCVPLVKDLTFDNAEELSEDGIPFLILFRKPDDTDTKVLFKEAVRRELADEKADIKCLVADGYKFVHPLHHLGKSIHDLPVLAIDTFKHMFLFKQDVTAGLRTPGVLKAFIADLLSEKLHRDFHTELEAAAAAAASAAQQHGGHVHLQPQPGAAQQPAPAQQLLQAQQQGHRPSFVPGQPRVGESGPEDSSGHLRREKTTEAAATTAETTDILESKFKKLRPSRARYTLLKEEL